MTTTLLSHLTLCVAAVGGPCSYEKVTVHLSILCVVPDATPLSDLQAQFLQPAIKSQLADVQQKITADGKLRPWTAFQVCFLGMHVQV